MSKSKNERSPNIFSIKINIITNETKEESKPIELTRNMIYHPSIISKPVSHSKYPFICDNIEYSAEMFKNGQSPEQIVDFFFNRKTFKTYLSLLKTQESADSDTDVIKKKTLEKNIMFMLQHLFPTKYPNIDYIFTIPYICCCWSWVGLSKHHEIKFFVQRTLDVSKP